jgi:hypothetical protein
LPRLKSLPRFAGISLGSLGVVICAAATIAVWIVSVRLGRITESLFSKIDGSLTATGQRVVQTKDRVAAATIAASDIAQTLRDWTTQGASQRLAWQLNTGERTERLTSILQQADDWLEVGESSLGLIQGMLSIGTSTSVAADTTLVDQLIEETASLRTQLAAAMEIVAGVHERLANASEENQSESPIEQTVPLALRAVATLGSMDRRLEKLAERISARQNQIQELKIATLRRILLVTTVVTLLFLWMAAGQVALCWLAWKGAN